MPLKVISTGTEPGLLILGKVQVASVSEITLATEYTAISESPNLHFASSQVELGQMNPSPYKVMFELSSWCTGPYCGVMEVM